MCLVLGAESLAAYTKAVDMLREEMAGAAGHGVSAASGLVEAAPARLPAKLLNNAAVLQLRAGRVRAAVALMEEAMQVSALLRLCLTGQTDNHAADVLIDHIHVLSHHVLPR